jgi:hypothetical protein
MTPATAAVAKIRKPTLVLVGPEERVFSIKEAVRDMWCTRLLVARGDRYGGKDRPGPEGVQKSVLSWKPVRI